MKKIVNSILKIGKIHTQRSLKVNLERKPYAHFSTFKSDSNPHQMPQEVKKIMQSQKVKRKPQQLPLLKDISQLKSVDQLPQIYKKFHFISKQQRQIALRYLLSAIYQQKIPFQAINQKNLIVYLNQFPHLKLQTQIFQINHCVNQINTINRELQNPQVKQKDLKEKNLLECFNKINDMYYISFNTTLKTIGKDHEARSKATLYKHFAEYNFQYLFNPKITDKTSSLYASNLSVLKKSRQFLIQSLNCHKQIILTEHKKLQSDEMNKLKDQDAERHQIKLNAIKQNIRKIVQSMGQCLYAIFKVINKQNRLLNDAFQHRNRKIQLLSLLDTYLPFYSVIPGIKQLSMMYYKLYKIKIEARFTAIGQPKTQEQLKEKVKSTIEDYNRLYKECLDGLDQAINSDNFNHLKDISMTILSIKFMIGRTIKKNQTELKNSLADEAKKIIDKMKKELKQPMQKYLLLIIKEMLNVKA